MHACRLVQLTAARNNQQESLEAERATCDQHRAAIAELAEDALAAKVGDPLHVLSGATSWQPPFMRLLLA